MARTTDGSTYEVTKQGKPILTVLELYRWAKHTAQNDSCQEEYEDEDDANLISLNGDADCEKDADGKHDVRTTLGKRMAGGYKRMEIIKCNGRNQEVTKEKEEIRKAEKCQ